MKRMARLVGGSSPPKDVPNLIPAPVLFTPKVREPEIEEDESETEEHSPEVAALLDDGSSHPRCDICGKTYSNMHSLRWVSKSCTFNNCHNRVGKLTL